MIDRASDGHLDFQGAPKSFFYDVPKCLDGEVAAIVLNAGDEFAFFADALSKIFLSQVKFDTSVTDLVADHKVGKVFFVAFPLGCTLNPDVFVLEL